MKIHEILCNWKTPRASRPVDYSRLAKLDQRYGDMWRTWVGIVSDYQMIQSQDDSRWLFTPYDYSGDNKSSFTWDFIERLELDACSKYSDLVVETRQYWDGVLPIGLSVGDGYKYFGLTASGIFVCGEEPDFQEVTEFGDDLDAFLLGLKGID